MSKYLVLICISLNLPVNAQSDTTRLNEPKPYQNTPVFVRFLVDQSNHRDLADLSALNFNTPAQPTLRVGFTTHPVWGRFTLVPPPTTSPTRPASYLIQLNNYYLDEADLFVPQSSGRYAVQHAGDQLPFSQRTIKNRLPTFRIDLVDASPTTLYVRVRGNQFLNVGIRVFPASEFVDTRLMDDLAIGILGLTLMRFMFHAALLFLLFSDRRFRAYSLFGMSVCLSYLVSSGNANILLPHTPYWANVMLFVVGSSMPLSVTYYVSVLYRIDNRYPWLQRVGWLMMGGCVLNMILNLFITNAYLTQAFVLFITLHVFGIAILMGLAYVRGKRVSVWYQIPLLLYIFSYLLHFLRNSYLNGRTLGYITGILHSDILQVAFVLEFLFVPFLVVIMLRQAYQERLEAQQTVQRKEIEQEQMLSRIHSLLEQRDTLHNYLRIQPNSLAPTRRLSTPPADDISGLEFLQSLYTVIEKQLDDADLDVDQLALSVAMSSRTLNRKLATILGMTASEVIRSYRLQRACELLLSGLSPTETAYRVGFGNPPYFSRVFREKYQISPTEFIQQQRLSENQPDLSKN